jgi:hypothetical protein
METRIYALECAEGRYYIEQLCLFIEIPQEDAINYFRHNRCEWTKKFEPLRVCQIIKNSSVDQVTKVYMRRYGINFVRGGRFSRIELSDREIKCLQREGVGVSQSNGQKSFTPGAPIQSNSSTLSSPLRNSDLSDRIIKFVLESFSVHSMDSEEIQLSFKRKGDEIVLDVNHETQSESSSSPKSYKFSNKKSRTNYDTLPRISLTTASSSSHSPCSQRPSISSDGSCPTRENIFLSPTENPRYQFELFPSTSISKSLPQFPLPSFASTPSKY